MRIFRILLASLISAACFFGTESQARFTIDVVSIAGDSPPDGNGPFSGYHPPVLNDSGEAGFLGILSGTGNTFLGVYRTDSAGDLTKIARAGDPAPGGSGVLSSRSIFRDPALNDAGYALFRAPIDQYSGGNLEGFGIYRGDGNGTLIEISRTGGLLPDNNSIVYSLGIPSTNNANQVAFNAHLNSPAGEEGIFRGDGVHDLVQIARTLDSTPSGDGSFIDFGDPALNDAGQVAFRGRFSGLSGGDTGIFFYDDLNGLTQVAREGDPAPNESSVFLELANPALNDIGQTAFVASLFEPGVVNSEENVLYRSDASGELVQVAREGDAAPDGNGTFQSFRGFGSAPRDSPAGLNNAGQIAFISALADTNGGHNDDEGLFRGDGTSSPVQIARKGQLTPDGNGTFLRLENPAINDHGQVVFAGYLDGTSPDYRGLFTHHDLYGMRTIVQEGDPLFDSTVSFIDFEGSSFIRGDSRSGLNNHGQVAFKFTLADGRQGIAIATPVPEPSALLLGLVAAGGFVLQRRRVANHRHA